MNSMYSRGASNQEWLMMAHVQYIFGFTIIHSFAFRNSNGLSLSFLASIFSSLLNKYFLHQISAKSEQNKMLLCPSRNMYNKKVNINVNVNLNFITMIIPIIFYQRNLFLEYHLGRHCSRVKG